MPGTDIWLEVLRPYGGLLPIQPTFATLDATISAFAEAIAARGDTFLRGTYMRVERSIKVSINVVSGMDFAMSTAKSAIQGVYELMSKEGGPQNRAITVFVNDRALGLLGRIMVSSDRYGSGTAPISNTAPAPTSEAARTTSGPGIVDNESIFVSRATNNMTSALANGASANLTASVIRFHK